MATLDHAVYRLGSNLFVVTVSGASGESAGYVGRCYRAIESRLEVVQRADGQPFEAHAPSAWQVIHRAINALETYAGGRAEEVRDFDVNPYRLEGAWSLPR